MKKKLTYLAMLESLVQVLEAKGVLTQKDWERQIKQNVIVR